LIDVNVEKTTLIPLTNSLYVPGRLSHIETVMVDIGTGYYAEKVFFVIDRY
jgi:prefoldin alpha subunit